MAGGIRDRGEAIESSAGKKGSNVTTVECIIFSGKRRHYFLRPTRKVAGDRKGEEAR